MVHILTAVDISSRSDTGRDHPACWETTRRRRRFIGPVVLNHASSHDVTGDSGRHATLPGEQAPSASSSGEVGPVSSVYMVVPAGVHDPARPSGGNIYDRRVSRGLAEAGWMAHELEVAGAWPCADAAARSALAVGMQAFPDDAVVLIDGLIASSVPDILDAERDRLRLVVLVHMPLGVGPAEIESPRRLPRPTTLDDIRRQELAALSAAAAVVTTSVWTRDWLLHQYALDPERVHVAQPGVDAAGLAPGTPAGTALLCVAAVTPGKGQDVLLAGLTRLADVPWQCVCAGSLDRDPAFADALARRVRNSQIGDRVRFVGPLDRADLEVAYAQADALVLASRAETYGMVVTEALARGLPVIATSVGGLPEALGRTNDRRPGLLVRPDDPAAMADALRRWLTDARLRERLRQDAKARRATLAPWESTTARLSGVLGAVAQAEPAMAGGAGFEPLEPTPGH
jgi:glycosyltransferase involved in cell wall biosynthesis